MTAPFIYKVKFTDENETRFCCGVTFANSYAEATANMTDYYGDKDVISFEMIGMSFSSVLEFPDTIRNGSFVTNHAAEAIADTVLEFDR